MSLAASRSVTKSFASFCIQVRGVNCSNDGLAFEFLNGSEDGILAKPDTPFAQVYHGNFTLVDPSVDGSDGDLTLFGDVALGDE